MSTTRIKYKLQQYPKLKQFIHYLICQPHGACPRWWTKILILPFFIKRGKGSHIRRSVRLDIFPFHPFVIGCHSFIESFSTVSNGVGPVHVGNYTRIGIGNTIIGPVTIGDHVALAQNITLSGLNHQYESVERTIHEQGVSTNEIRIDDDCWIGANSVLVAGVKIGKHSVVGAGSVVTKDIPSYCVAVGNPARIIKQYDFQKQEWVKIKSLSNPIHDQ